jgi:lipid-binding SYLF domain-containing protein
MEWFRIDAREGDMKQVKILVPVLMLLMCAAVSLRADDKKEDAEGRLQRAAKTLQDLAGAPDKGIPDEVFRGAKCVAVVPNLTKAGFIVAGKRGRGVATCRLENGGWSAPVFFSITGGSWGAQIGIEDIHLVMMIMNDEGMRALLRDKFQIGGEASAAAGPVGRHAAAGTDWKLETQILTYSRSKGIFAGVDLGGSVIQKEKDTTEALYGKDIPSADLLMGKVRPPSDARVFLDAVARIKSDVKG